MPDENIHDIISANIFKSLLRANNYRFSIHLYCECGSVHSNGLELFFSLCRSSVAAVAVAAAFPCESHRNDLLFFLLSIVKFDLRTSKQFFKRQSIISPFFYLKSFFLFLVLHRRQTKKCIETTSSKNKRA